MTNTINQRRQEILQSLIEKDKPNQEYWYHRFDQYSVNELNKIYGINLDATSLNESGGDITYHFACLYKKPGLDGCYGSGNLNGASRGSMMNPRKPSSAELIANLIHGRNMSKWEDKLFNLPDAVKVACKTLEYGVPECGLSVPSYAVDVFSDDVRNRTLTREEFETQITSRITGARGVAQDKLLELYLEFKRNGQYFEAGKDYPTSLPKPSYNMTRDEQMEKQNRKEITESQWSEYKRVHLNPDTQEQVRSEIDHLNPATQEKGFIGRVRNYLSRRYNLGK